MKKLTIMILLTLIGIGSSASAYDYTVVNKTNQKITVSVTPSLGPTYSWVLAPAGTTIPASEVIQAALSNPLAVPPGIDDIPGTEFSDTKVFKFTGASIGLCLNKGSIKVNGKTADYTGGPSTEDILKTLGVAATEYCGDMDISISQNADGTFVAAVVKSKYLKLYGDRYQ